MKKSFSASMPRTVANLAVVTGGLHGRGVKPGLEQTLLQAFEQELQALELQELQLLPRPRF